MAGRKLNAILMEMNWYSFTMLNNYKIHQEVFHTFNLYNSAMKMEKTILSNHGNVLNFKISVISQIENELCKDQNDFLKHHLR